MNMSVYRAATREAIKELIAEQAQPGRFGLLLSDDGLEIAADRIVDLMDTTLRLRSGVREHMDRAISAEQQQSAPATPSVTPTLSMRLPRTRVALSDAERIGLRNRS